jgi:hypothetical protein
VFIGNLESIMFDVETLEEDDDEEGDDVLDPTDLELSIELTMLLGTSHLSIIKKNMTIGVF